MQDIQDLQKGLLLLKGFLETEVTSLNNSQKILRFVVEKSLSQIRNEVPIHKIKFNYEEIFDDVWEGLSDKSNASVYVRRNRKGITDILDNNSTFFKYCLSRGYQKELSFRWEESKGHHKTYHWVELNNTHVSSEDHGNCTYIAEKLPKPYFWVKPLLNVSINVKNIFIGFLLMPMFAASGLIFYWSRNDIELNIPSIILIAFLFVSFWVARVIYKLMENGVTLAPFWMYRFSQFNVLFAVFRGKKSSDGKSSKYVELVQYSAVCPICNDKLFIDNGGREFNFRLIGKCGIAPKEHIFSFDHYSKKGKFLR